RNTMAQYGYGNAGQLLTSNGAGILPSFKGSSVVANTGTNLGISYSAGTFTVTDQLGNALSASNPALVTFQDATNIGRLNTQLVTVPYTLTDAAGTNDIGANLFGITTGVAWALDCPFYLYAVINSAQNDVAFGIARVPHLTVAPV